MYLLNRKPKAPAINLEKPSGFSIDVLIKGYDEPFRIFYARGRSMVDGSAIDCLYTLKRSNSLEFLLRGSKITHVALNAESPIFHAVKSFQLQTLAQDHARLTITTTRSRRKDLPRPALEPFELRI